MTADLPAWVPAGPGTSPALPEPEGRGGRVVVLLCTEGALSGGWSGTVAVELVESWGRAGARVVVADAGLSTPLLHEALEIPNHEGLVDALRWGVSVQRIIRRPEGRRFLAVTAGTAVADTAMVLGLPRWHALCSGFREAGVTMAVLVPCWEEALAAVLKEADGVVLLAEPEEDVQDLVAGLAVPVFAVTGRAPSDATADGDDAPAGEVVADEPTPEDGWAEPLAEAEASLDRGDLADLTSGDEPDFAPVEDEGPAEASGVAPVEDQAIGEAFETAPVEGDWSVPGDDAAVADASSGGDPSDGGASGFPVPDPEDEADSEPQEGPPLPMLDAAPREAAEGVSEPVRLPQAPFVPVFDTDFALPDPIPVPPSLEEIVEESEASGRRGRLGVLLFLLLIVVVAAAVWFGYLEIPGLSGLRDAVSSEPVAPSTVATMVFASDASVVQGYSLSLGAYQDGTVAAQSVARLSEQVPGVLFQSVPVDVDGTLYYRVLAGPAADTAALSALAGHIAQTASLDPEPWVARWTPFAFRLDEMPDRGDAERRVEVLDSLGISAYVLAVDDADGSTVYRVYAGAFGDATEASYLSGILDERGLSGATLSDRTGRLPE